MCREYIEVYDGIGLDIPRWVEIRWGRGHSGLDFA